MTLIRIIYIYSLLFIHDNGSTLTEKIFILLICYTFFCVYLISFQLRVTVFIIFDIKVMIAHIQHTCHTLSSNFHSSLTNIFSFLIFFLYTEKGYEVPEPYKSWWYSFILTYIATEDSEMFFIQISRRVFCQSTLMFRVNSCEAILCYMTTVFYRNVTWECQALS